MDESSKLPLHLEENIERLPISATLAMNELIAEKEKDGKKTILHMGFGEAALPLHPLLKNALVESAAFTKYSPILGLPELRTAIAGFLNRTRKIKVNTHQVVVGPGSKAMLFALFHIFEGDALIPAPSWVSYAPAVRMAGKKVTYVQTDVKDNHRLSIENLNRAVKNAKKEGADPRILIINSPHCPVGVMFAPEDVKIIAEWARKNHMTLISDEIYAELAFGWRKHVSPAVHYPEGTIITGGISKTLSAGGWRLGFASFPDTSEGKKAVKAMQAMGSEIWASAASPIQKAAVAAFAPNASIDHYLHQASLLFGYITGRMYQKFKQLDVPCPRPAGGFYLYPDFSRWRSQLLKRGVRTGKELSNYLLEEWEIASVPASEFGEDIHALRLRLSTNKLCEPEKGTSAKKREAFLWNLLHTAENKNFKPELPVLAFAQEKWIRVIMSLNEKTKQ
jgi:aspartate aminotransferase